MLFLIFLKVCIAISRTEWHFCDFSLKHQTVKHDFAIENSLRLYLYSIIFGEKFANRLLLIFVMAVPSFHLKFLKQLRRRQSNLFQALRNTRTRRREQNIFWDVRARKFHSTMVNTMLSEVESFLEGKVQILKTIFIKNYER